MTDYGYSVEVAEGYDEAVIRARLALRGEGFSILTESHVGGMLGPEAGAERQYLIMGAWSSGQHDETDGDVRIAVNLPCNVVVQESGASAFVVALDPEDSVDPTDPRSRDLASAARSALGRAFERIPELGR